LIQGVGSAGRLARDGRPRVEAADHRLVAVERLPRAAVEQHLPQQRHERDQERDARKSPEEASHRPQRTALTPVSDLCDNCWVMKAITSDLLLT
jgi:hypothetical protein